MHVAQRITGDRDLGRANRILDLALGVLGVMPIVIFTVGACAAPAFQPPLRALTLGWTSCLLAFLAGVRRGLTFSEEGGGRAGELMTMLAVFFAGVLSALSQNLWIAAVGLAAVGILDAIAARRLEAPDYFAILRPIQMAIGASCLAVTACIAV